MSARSHASLLTGAARRRARAAVDRTRRRRLERRLAGPRLLRAFADANPRARFIEIGSNDGAQHDHLRSFILKREWTGVMVEPVPYVFERLKENYGSVDRVALENAAIGEVDGKLPFYCLADAPPEERRELPDWYDGVGSFSREVVLSHARDIPDVHDRIVRLEVPTLTFDSLCERHGIAQVDLLVTDTEGYDWEILRRIDLDRWRPQLIVYEHYHLSPAARRDCAAYLESEGYGTMEEGFDTFCIDDAVAGPLRAAWNRMRPAVAGVAKYMEA
jgi:FkbM family methyltransferase